MGARAGNETRTLLGDRGDQFKHIRLFRLGPEIDEVGAFQFATEQRAGARAGKSKSEYALRVLSENESIAQRAPDWSGFDIAPLGSRAKAAPLIPVFEHLPARSVF